MNPLARAIIRGAAPAGPSLPIDWSTDLTFARASAATYWDGTTLTRYSSGVARVLGDGSLYVEGSRTNEVNSSHVMAVSASCTIAADTGTDPSGGSTCDQVTITSVSGRAQSIATNPSATLDTVSTIFSKYVGGAANWLHLYPSSIAFTAPASWGRFTSKLAAATGINTYVVRVQENDTPNDNVALFWGAQVEWAAAFASQLIETSGAPATRLADDASVADAAVPAAMRSGSFKVTIKPRRASTEAADTSTETLLAFGAGTDNRIYIDASNHVLVRQGGATKVDSGALTWSADQSITLTFNAATGALTVAGATTGNGTTTTTAWTMPSGDVQVGNDAALGTAFFGSIGAPSAP